jgi:hypothetical protein
MQLGGHTDILHSFIRNHVLGLLRFLTPDQKRKCAIVSEELCQLVSNDAAFLSGPITVDESWICGYDPEIKQQSLQWKSPNPQRLRKVRWVTSRGLFTKNLSWQAKQSILLTTVTFYEDCMKMCKGFNLNFGDERAGCCITITRCHMLPFSPGNLNQKEHDCLPPPILPL